MLVALAFCPSPESCATDFLPALDGHTTVFVQPNVTDDFQGARAAIDAVHAQSGRRYRAVITASDGKTGGASALIRRVVERWWEPRNVQQFDPETDITVVVDIGNRTVAMDIPPSLLEQADLGMRSIDRDVITKVFVPRAKNMRYAEGLAAMIVATDQVLTTGSADRVRRAERARIFRTQTLPRAALGVAGAGIVAAFALGRWRHTVRFASARTALAAFKQDVVALSDLLDSAQERHRLLPHTDPDFLTPMRGMTRDAFDAVQQAIGRYRERWLSLMDTWEKAEERLGQEWFLGTSASEDVVAWLARAEVRPPLEEVKAACHAPLDALEQSHETAREAVTALQSDLALVRERLDGVAVRGRSTTALEATVDEAARAKDLADDDVEPDPVAARGRLEAAREGLARVLVTLDAIEAADDRRLRVTGRVDEVRKRVAAMRAEGWLLTEPGADPSPLVAKADNEADLAARLLDVTEVANASTHLSLAEAACADAATFLDSVLAARTRAEELAPAIAAKLDESAASRARAEADRGHLAGSYALSAWSDIADNLVNADEGVAHARQLLVAAGAAVSSEKQHFFRAVASLEEALRQTLWAWSLRSAISERRQELDQLAAQLPARLEAGMKATAALELTLGRQRTDRARANERCREARRLLSRAGDSVRATQPDPRQIDRVIDAAASALARGEELAAEDDRLSGEARADIAEADAAIRRAAAWYAEGVRADTGGAKSARDTAERLLAQQRYEDAIRAAAEASEQARGAYATASAEADRRRQHREAEQRRRQMEEAFRRTKEGAGPWVITLPAGPFSGPSPWQSGGSSSPSTRSTAGGEAEGGEWSREIAAGRW